MSSAAKALSGMLRSRRRLAIALAVVVVFMVATSIGLLVSGQRVLVSETVLDPQTPYSVEQAPEWVNERGKYGYGILLCRYFTGRSLKGQFFPYRAHNVDQPFWASRYARDMCPFLYRPE